MIDKMLEDNVAQEVLTKKRVILAVFIGLVLVLQGLMFFPGAGYFPISKVLWSPLPLACIAFMTLTTICLSENPKEFWPRLRGQLLVLAFFFVVTIGITFRFGHTWEEFATWVRAIPFPWLVQMGLFALTVATYEEIIIRKWLLNGLLKVAWPSVAIFIAAMVFYLLHPPLKPAILFFSLATTVIAYKYRSVLATIVLHMSLDWIWFAKMSFYQTHVPVVETLTQVSFVGRDIAFLAICLAVWGLSKAWTLSKAVRKTIKRHQRRMCARPMSVQPRQYLVGTDQELSGETSPEVIRTAAKE